MCVVPIADVGKDSRKLICRKLNAPNPFLEISFLDLFKSLLFHFSTIHLKNLNYIKNLELQQARTRNNPKKKQANNPTTTSKSNSKPTTKVFPKRKQKKSQSVPPKPRNTRKRT